MNRIETSEANEVQETQSNGILLKVNHRAFKITINVNKREDKKELIVKLRNEIFQILKPYFFE